MNILQNIKLIKSLIDKHIEEWHSAGTMDFIYHNNNKFLKQIINILNSNYKLWHLEDVARDPVANDNVIANIKRKIDRENQTRNDKIEQMDILIDKFLKDKQIKPKTDKFNSETPGSIIDRITILSLKIYHMKEQTERKDTDKEHIESCKNKLQILKIQRDDLLTALKELISELLNGNKLHKVYFQFKMYNDPSLNPAIYSKGKQFENINN